MGCLFEDIEGLFVWTRWSVIQAIQLIWKLQNPFVSYLWLINQSNSRIHSATRISRITRFPFISCFVQFRLCSWKHVDGIPALRQVKWDKSKTYNDVIKRTSASCKWLLYSVIQWLNQLDHQSSFVWLSIFFKSRVGVNSFKKEFYEFPWIFWINTRQFPWIVLQKYCFFPVSYRFI